MTPKNSEVDRLEALSGDRATPLDLVSLNPLAQKAQGDEYSRPQTPGELATHCVALEPGQGRRLHDPGIPFLMRRETMPHSLSLRTPYGLKCRHPIDSALELENERAEPTLLHRRLTSERTGEPAARLGHPAEIE
jgi:hypothetical protein